MPPRRVAFFRNLNQGQRGQPSTAQLVEALTASGAVGVTPVRSNGTVVFEAIDAERTLADALDRLAEASPWQDAAFARDGDWLAARAAEFPIGVPAPQLELSLFAEGRVPTHPVPFLGKGCTVVVAGPGYAITVNDSPGTSQATPTLERVLGAPVTSRSGSTVQLLLESL